MSHRVIIYHGQCNISGYDNHYDDSDEDHGEFRFLEYQKQCKIDLMKRKERKRSRSDDDTEEKQDRALQNAIDDILSAMPVSFSSSSMKKLKENGNSGSSNSNSNSGHSSAASAGCGGGISRSVLKASMNAVMPITGSAKLNTEDSLNNGAKFSFYTANQDEMDLLVSFKGRSKAMDEIMKIRSGVSPSICPVEVSVDAWSCAGFLPTIPETSEFDYAKEPKCMSSTRRNSVEDDTQLIRISNDSSTDLLSDDSDCRDSWENPVQTGKGSIENEENQQKTWKFILKEIKRTKNVLLAVSILVLIAACLIKAA
jgi:hypothetical protein